MMEMKNVKIYMGKERRTEEITVTASEAKEGLVDIPLAEYCSVLVERGGESIPIKECVLSLELEDNGGSTSGIKYLGLVEGDKIKICYNPLGKTQIGSCNEVLFKHYEGGGLGLSFESMILKRRYQDYFEDVNKRYHSYREEPEKIPSLILEVLDPQDKYFIDGFSINGITLTKHALNLTGTADNFLRVETR